MDNPFAISRLLVITIIIINIFNLNMDTLHFSVRTKQDGLIRLPVMVYLGQDRSLEGLTIIRRPFLLHFSSVTGRLTGGYNNVTTAVTD